MSRRLAQSDCDAAWGVHISRFVVKECDGCEPPRGAHLPALRHFLELVFVFLVEFGNTQAILVWNFGLQDDLYLLRRNLGSIPWVSVLHELAADDSELDLTCQACLLIDHVGQLWFFSGLCSSTAAFGGGGGSHL